MRPSARLRKYRQKSDYSPEYVAVEAGISVPAYYDLEGADDLENCIELGKIASLASVLGVGSADFFTGNTATEAINPKALASKVEKLARERKIGLPELEDEIGWALEGFLCAPDEAILLWNIECLWDVCRVLGCSWVSVLVGVDAVIKEISKANQGGQSRGANVKSKD